MLALKSALEAQDRVDVLIFDEVDSGIGGTVAQAVGERLRRLAITSDGGKSKLTLLGQQYHGARQDAIQLRSNVEQLLERLDRLEAETACRSLLEAHHRLCDATRLRALTALGSEEERINLIETHTADLGRRLDELRRYL